jgi:glyoxylase-like metal-dependent hydrolase (beta-lactamase superfamily II)
MTFKKVLLRGLAAVAAVLFIAAAGTMLTFTSAKLELPPVDVGELPPASPPPELSLSALPAGSYETRAMLAFRGGAWGDVRRFSTTAVLIRHPKGNLLVDAGMGKNVDQHIKLIPAVQRAPYDKGTPAVERLAAGGIRPGDLAGIIPTHAHWDHISGVEDFGGVPVLEHAAGKAFIDSKADGTQVLHSFRRVAFKEYYFEGGPYLGFPKSHDVWGDGSVVIVPALGHTPDSVIVFVALPSGARYAMIGDIVFQSEGIDLPAEKPLLLRRAIGEDDQRVRMDIALLRAASRKYPQLHPIPAHDSAAFRQLPVFPAAAR